MPRKRRSSKKHNEKGNIGLKRKVISPIDNEQSGQSEHSDQTGLHSGQHAGGVHKDEVNTQTSKRLHFSSPDYQNTDNSFNMANFQQTPHQNPTSPYTPQYTQLSPGYMGQWPPPPPPSNSMQQASTSNAIPPWASVIMEDIKVIKQDIHEIHTIKKTVNIISTKLTDLENKVTNIDGRMIEVEKSCSMVHSDLENKTRDLNKAKSEINELQKKREKVENQVKQMEEEIKQMNSKMSDCEARSMRNNLIFYGIQEKENENCETEMKKMISEKLQIDTSEMRIDRGHRMGNHNARKPRPTVACFHYYSDRENERAKGYELNQQLRQEGYGISIQRPKQIREARKSLYNVMKHERDVKGNRVKFVGDKLFINDVQYVPPE